MDDQQQQRINRAAQEFTDALVAAYKTTADSTVVAQQAGAQQFEYFFNTVIDNLRAQAGGNLEMTRQLAGQQRLAQEATRELAQASTDNYMDLLDSMFSFYQGGASRTQRRAEEARRRIEEAEARAEESQVRATKAENSRSEAERQTEEAQSRAKEAEKSARAARRRAKEAESSAEEAEGRVELAEGRAEQAERRAEEAEGRAEEAERRVEEAERRAGEAERSRSEAENRGGDEEDDTTDAAVRQPQNQWVRTSGRSRVRGRNTRSQGRSFGRR